MDNNKKYNISIGHCNTLENGEKLMKLLQNSNKQIDNIYLMDMGCALGVHGGPGTLAVSTQLV